MCVLLCFVDPSLFCLYLLNIYHFTYTFSHAHTEAHTHKHTCTISTQEEWRQPGTKCQKKQIFTNLKKRFEHIELPAKLLDYFLRSNKSNINQYHYFVVLADWLSVPLHDAARSRELWQLCKSSSSARGAEKTAARFHHPRCLALGGVLKSRSCMKYV